jgi:hypothetical protein
MVLPLTASPVLSGELLDAAVGRTQTRLIGADQHGVGGERIGAQVWICASPAPASGPSR